MRGLGFVVGIVVILGILFANVAIHFGTQESVTFKVEHRERVISRDSEGKTTARYMVWAVTEAGSEVFENTDSVLALKFNSADLYGAMTVGKTCDATVTGFRVPFLSMNRNIIAAECSGKTEAAQG
jgi:hypothetical protein